jgi:hypothetical protein
MRRRALCLLAVAIVAAPAPAPAQPASPISVQLQYPRPPHGCPTSETFGRNLYSELGYEPFSAMASGRLVVDLAGTNAGFVVAAKQYDPSGGVVFDSDAIRGSDCHALVGALITKLAIVWPQKPRAAKTEAAKIEAVKIEAVQIEPVQKATASARIRIGAALGVRLGTAPRPAFGVAADVGVRWTHASLALEGRFAAPAGAEVPGLGQGARVNVSLVSAVLVPCAHWRWLCGCGLAEVGAVRTSSTTVKLSGDTSGPYGAAGARAALEIPLSIDHLAARIAGDVTGVFERVRLSTAGGPPGGVWTMPSATGAFVVGVVGHF